VNVRAALAAPVFCAALVAGCAKKQDVVEAPPKKLSAQDEILHVASVWQAMETEHGARMPPSPVATFEAKRTSVITLQAGSNDGEERFEVVERFELRNGQPFDCRAKASTRIHVRFGRRHGHPAMELIRPPTTLRRDCRPSNYPELEIALGGGSSRYQLEDERMVAFQPLGEKREYLPIE
jgi:hypothetical protein